MTGQDLINAINDSTNKVYESIESRYNSAIERARAEHDYRILLNKAMVAERANGMAATALYEYCKGLPTVAQARLKRDIAQVKEDYYNDRIYYYKTELRIAENQLAAERKGL